MQISTVTFLSLLNFFFLAIALLAVYQLAYKYRMEWRKSDALRRESEAYRDLFNNTWDGVFHIDTTGAFSFINRSGARLLGYASEEALMASGKRVQDFIVNPSNLHTHFAGISHVGSIANKRITLQCCDDKETIVELTANLRKDSQGGVIGYEGIFRDVTTRVRLDHDLKRHQENLETLIAERTADLARANEDLKLEIEERKKADAVIKAALAERELLLKEVHHRVKNNLQIIVSLINLQALKIESEDVLALFRESQDRIRTIALVHEKLYSSDNFSEIGFAGYVRSLAFRLYQSHRRDMDVIRFDMNVDEFALPIDIAIPCGLVINELLANALNHAYPEEVPEDAEIMVQAKLNTDNEYEIEVKDNGVGIPVSVDPLTTESLGMRMLYILVEEQLKGKIHFAVNGGTTCRIQFSALNCGFQPVN